MNGCTLVGAEAVELYFYDELDAAQRARMEAHLAQCAACRQVLGDLRVIGRALADRPAIDAPPAGDWSGFMRRLDDACRHESVKDATTAARQEEDGTRRHLGRWPSRAAMAIAASLIVATAGAVLTLWMRPAPVAVPTPTPTVQAPPPSTPVASTPAAGDRGPTRALAALSEQHFEKSKLVVLGLVARDPDHTKAKDWAYERDLAGSLLEDTRLYRRAAQERGLSDIAHVMGDLETVLLETSMSDHGDAASLERVQQLIRKRDLVVKMQVVGSTGI
jgi:hypothetical protein